MAKVSRKGAGGLVESLAQKAVRGYLKEATEGKPVKKVPSLKFDRVKGSDHGVPGDPNLGEYNREATGLTLGRQEELDDMNMVNEMRRKEKRETAPTPVSGTPKEPRALRKSEKYKQAEEERRGGRIELGKVGGGKSKRRMDKRGRR